MGQRPAKSDGDAAVGRRKRLPHVGCCGAGAFACQPGVFNGVGECCWRLLPVVAQFVDLTGVIGE
jgi:hypothetical protein